MIPAGRLSNKFPFKSYWYTVPSLAKSLASCTNKTLLIKSRLYAPVGVIAAVGHDAGLVLDFTTAQEYDAFKKYRSVPSVFSSIA